MKSICNKNFIDRTMSCFTMFRFDMFLERGVDRECERTESALVRFLPVVSPQVDAHPCLDGFTALYASLHLHLASVSSDVREERSLMRETFLTLETLVRLLIGVRVHVVY